MGDAISYGGGVSQQLVTRHCPGRSAIRYGREQGQVVVELQLPTINQHTAAYILRHQLSVHVANGLVNDSGTGEQRNNQNESAGLTRTTGERSKAGSAVR